MGSSCRVGERRNQNTVLGLTNEGVSSDSGGLNDVESSIRQASAGPAIDARAARRVRLEHDRDLCGLRAQATGPALFRTVRTRLTRFHAGCAVGASVENHTVVRISRCAARSSPCRPTDALSFRPLAQHALDRDLHTRHAARLQVRERIDLGALAAAGHEFVRDEPRTQLADAAPAGGADPGRDGTALAHGVRGPGPMVQVQARGSGAGPGNRRCRRWSRIRCRPLSARRSPSTRGVCATSPRSARRSAREHAQAWSG